MVSGAAAAAALVAAAEHALVTDHSFAPLQKQLIWQG